MNNRPSVDELLREARLKPSVSMKQRETMMDCAIELAPVFVLLRQKGFSQKYCSNWFSKRGYKVSPGMLRLGSKHRSALSVTPDEYGELWEVREKKLVQLTHDEKLKKLNGKAT